MWGVDFGQYARELKVIIFGAGGGGIWFLLKHKIKSICHKDDILRYGACQHVGKFWRSGIFDTKGWTGRGRLSTCRSYRSILFRVVGCHVLSLILLVRKHGNFIFFNHAYFVMYFLHLSYLIKASKNSISFACCIYWIVLVLTKWASYVNSYFFTCKDDHVDQSRGK